MPRREKAATPMRGGQSHQGRPARASAFDVPSCASPATNIAAQAGMRQMTLSHHPFPHTPVPRMFLRKEADHGA